MLNTFELERGLLDAKDLVESLEILPAETGKAIKRDGSTEST